MNFLLEKQLLHQQIQEQVVVQQDAFGCKGFEQKTFDQTKGISMAGSPTYTANVSLDSDFGDVKQLLQEQFQQLSPAESAR